MPLREAAEEVVVCGGGGLPWNLDDRPLDDTVRRLYLAILDREASVSEISYWAGRIARGAELNELARMIMGSSEVQSSLPSNASPVEHLRSVYGHLWSQDAPMSLSAEWLAQLTSGATASQLVVELVQSDSAVEVTQTAASQTEVEGALCRLYLAGLGRSPDLAGFSYWRGQEMTQVPELISRSPEFLYHHPADLTNSEFIRSIYRQVLRRNPDPGGEAFWLEAMNGGLSRGQLLEAVSNSPEFVLQTNTML